MATKKSNASAKKGQKLTVEQNEEMKQLKPFCENASVAMYWKQKADELRPLAAKELQERLDADPETKDFTGTVIYMCDNMMYKIRVQRKGKCNWREKHLNDPLLNEYKQKMNEIDKLKERTSELEAILAKNHPKCLVYDFIIGILSK